MTVFHAALIHEPNDVSVMSRPDLCAAANDNSPPPRLPPSPRLRRTRRGTARPDGACAYDQASPGDFALASAADNLIALTYPSGRIVNYTRDALNRVVNVSTRTNAAGAPVPVASNITYAPFGPLTGLTFGNGVVLAQSHDADYRLTGIAATGVQNLAYSYDAAGNITAIADAITSNKPAGNQSFGYDDLNRLTAANGVYGTQSYAYDVSGNRIAAVRYGVTATYSYALSSNRLLSVNSSVAGGAHSSFSYDQAGHAANDNRASNVNYSYAYSAAGDMAAFMRNSARPWRATPQTRRICVSLKTCPGPACPKRILSMTRRVICWPSIMASRARYCAK